MITNLPILVRYKGTLTKKRKLTKNSKIPQCLPLLPCVTLLKFLIHGKVLITPCEHVMDNGATTESLPPDKWRALIIDWDVLGDGVILLSFPSLLSFNVEIVTYYIKLI